MPTSLARRELIRKLRTLGFDGPFSGSKHQFMAKGQRKVRIPNPHGSGDISVGLVNEIRKQAGIGQKEWDDA